MPSSSVNDTSETMRDVITLGISVVPIRLDGSKRPAGKVLPKEWNEAEQQMKAVWKPFQTRFATDEEIEGWNGYGIAAVCGKISGDLELLDGDCVKSVEPFLALVKEHSPTLYDKLVLIETPRGGLHSPFRCEKIERNQPLARRLVIVPKDTKDAKLYKGSAEEFKGKWVKAEIIFETRGEGGYFVLPGSPLNVHSAGKPYRVVKGSLDAIPTLTPQERDLLFALAASFDEMPKEAEKAKSNGRAAKLSPGDDYNLRGDPASILIKHGWTLTHRDGSIEYYKRPGKTDEGHSASLHAIGHNNFYCFSTAAAPFEPERKYDAFGVYSRLEHNGDDKAAAKQLAAEGFGTPSSNGKPTRTGAAIWRNADYDLDVTVTGWMATPAGEWFASIKGSKTGIPQNQIHFPDTKKPVAAKKIDGKQANTDDDKKRVPTNDELRDRWMERHPDTVFMRDDFYRYSNGLWLRLEKKMVKKELDEIICAAKAEEVRPSGSLLTSVLILAQAKAAECDDKFDHNPDYLVCRNGALHIPTLTLEPHRKDLYATTGVNFDYDPDAKRPAWDTYIEWLRLNVCEDVEEGEKVVEFLQEFAGLCLTTNMQHEKSVWLVGEPGGGKSTFIEGIKTAISDRSVKLGLYEIVQRFGCANLPGKTLATCSEQPSDYMQSTSRLNEIISGETINIERKYHDAYPIQSDRQALIRDERSASYQ